MIYLIGEYSVYNRDAAIFGIKSLFDRNKIDCQIITPSMDVKLQKNRAAALSSFQAGTIWSIYDCFTGRTLLEDKRLLPENFQAPAGFQPQSGFASLTYKKDNERLDLKIRADGSVEAVEYFEDEQLISRDVYDDGGHLTANEYILGEDSLSKVLDPSGQPVFEVYLTGKYRKVVKIKYVRDKQDFLSEASFWRWAFLQLLANKQADDKFFIMNENFRKAILTADFNKRGVYLLPTQPLTENNLQDIMFDHYEKLVFNSHFEKDKIAELFDERSQSQLYWNNFISTEKLQPNYSVSEFPVFLSLGSASETVNFEEVAGFVAETLKSEEKVNFVIEFTLLRDQVDFLALLASKGLDEDLLKSRVEAMTRPFPETRTAAMAKSVLYIHYQNAEMISQPLMLAIAGEKPIFALAGDPLLADYIEDSNGKMISDISVSRLIKQLIYDVEFIKYVAPDLAKVREKFADKATTARWTEIFADQGQRL